MYVFVCAYFQQQQQQLIKSKTNQMTDTCNNCFGSIMLSKSTLSRIIIILLILLSGTIALSDNNDYNDATTITTPTFETWDGKNNNQQHEQLHQREYHSNYHYPLTRKLYDDHNVPVLFHRRTTTISSSKRCVKTEKGLRTAINKAVEFTPTDINICTNYMKINTSEINPITTLRGIHLEHKDIHFNCILPINSTIKSCTIDAQKIARHIFTFNSKLSFHNIIFTNGIAFDSTDTESEVNFGGSFFVGYNSVIKMNECSFYNNDAASRGGAMFVDIYATIEMLNVTMRNNTAGRRGGAISCAKQCNVALDNIRMSNNSAIKGGALDVDESYVRMNNSELVNNHAANKPYGVISVTSNSDATLNNVNMMNNSGGGISVDWSNITLNNVELNRGGHIFLAASYGNFNQVSFTLNNGIELVDSRIKLAKVSFFKSNATTNTDEADVVAAAFGYSEDGWIQYQFSYLNFPLSPPPRVKQRRTKVEPYNRTTTLSSTNCVTSYAMLKKQVHTCDNTLNAAPCMINICKIRIKRKINDNDSRAIFLSNKNTIINCNLGESRRCTIDGRGLSRIFYISNSFVIFQNIIFANGYSSTDGSALWIENKSTANLVNCSVVNNSALTGGAVTIKNSTLTMEGIKSSVLNNTGKRPPLASYSSDLNVFDTLFDGNIMTEFGKGIFLMNSTTDIYNITFAESVPTVHNIDIDFTYINCTVFVAFDPTDLKKDATCLDLTI